MTDSRNGTCRTCRISTCDLSSVFQVMGNSYIVADLIQLTTTISIHRTDQLSHQICKNCLTTITSAFKLRVRSLQNDQQIREIHERYWIEPYCRMCSTQDDLQPISISISSQPTFLLILSFCPIDFQPNDKFSQEICLRCLEIVHKISELRKMCNTQSSLLSPDLPNTSEKIIKPDPEEAEKLPISFVSIGNLIPEMEIKTEVDESIEAYSYESVDSSPADTPRPGRDKPSERKSYTLSQKLTILENYQPDTPGSGFASLARKNNITTATLRGWYKIKDKLIAQQINSERSNKCRLTGGGRKSQYPELELQLFSWLQEQNSLLSDREVLKKAADLVEKNSIDNFKVSSGWLKRFKKRFNLLEKVDTSDEFMRCDNDTEWE